MPKVAPEDSCRTCLKRKIKCDGQFPICRRCTIARRECVRPGKSFRFIVQGSNAIDSQSISSSRITNRQIDADSASSLAASEPRTALADIEIAKLFNHYINVLAPWYDLNDSQELFGTVVPLSALSYPVLFKAIIAFSAAHKSKTSGNLQHIANAFHTACIQELLLSIEKDDARPHDKELAATCLLRSYEILSADSRQGQHHLLGAYSFAVGEPIDFSSHGLLQAGAWNYLREEITVALECRRAVRIGQIFESHQNTDFTDDMQANHISLLLARIVNFSFSDSSTWTTQRDKLIDWQMLRSELVEWKTNLPPSFEPYSTAPKASNPFPSLWMLRPWHIAARQYFAVAEMLLTLFNPSPAGGHVSRKDLEFAEDRALMVCGLAWTNEDASARVNAFGPLAFCGRYLYQDHHRRAIETLLLDMSSLTAWPVHFIIQDLQDCWTQR